MPSVHVRSTTSVVSSSLTPKKAGVLSRRPLLRNALLTDLQNGSYLAVIFSLLECLFMITLVIFDIYCLAEASPGTTHYRYYGISFLFVYSGSPPVRNALIVCSVISFILSIYLLVSTVILMKALRKEQETSFIHWLRAMFIFTIWRFVAIIFRSMANDLYFGYHQAMLVIWLFLIALNIFMWLVVYSNYQELTDITRLEDMAKLKMSTLSSLNASRSLSHHSIDSMTKNVHAHPHPQSRSSTSPRSSTSTATA